MAASHAMRVEKATNKYITEKSAIIGSIATPKLPFTLDVPMLITAGYLPIGFSPQNNFSNTYKTLVYQPTPQKFHHMTFLEGGVTQSLSVARKIATRIGGSGGYIEDGVAKGVLGSWSENLSAFGGHNPGNGHVVMAGFFSNGAVVNDYLYRKSVPGHPELNTMSTALNMSGNDLNAIKNLNATGAAQINGDITSGGNVSVGGTVTASTADVAGETTTGGWFRTRGDTGWYSEKWGGGWHMTDSTWIKAYNGKSIYSSGQVRGGTVAAEGRLSTGEFLQLDKVSIVGNSCSPTGLISRDAQGATLSCQSGVWANAMSTNVFTSSSGNMGVHKFCALQSVAWGMHEGSGSINGQCSISRKKDGSWYLIDHHGSCRAICF
ncbi:shufflon system plasmid conjugative transfer pilus tip adhesin PilV [Xenorhabdus bovienii]|uniref:shufflon system plasmid conjugative transfer pilus tip adhesin PilV n=1 Tax=Xenorhabdus bovienii TaxID=40576 RepID=UPI003DA200CF